VRRLIEIERDVRLSLMVRLVPGEDLKDLDERQIPLLKALWDRAQILIAEAHERG
jgi:hypothetical protein